MTDAGHKRPVEDDSFGVARRPTVVTGLSYIPAMPNVYVLHHLHVFVEDDEDYKFIGVYGSHGEALRAVERLRLAPGFRDFPALVADLGHGPAKGSGFYLNEHELDQDGWASGFDTV